MMELPEKVEESIKKLPAAAQEKAKARYKKARYESGEAIGVIAAQSIAEPATQTTLRAYHRVGRTELHTTSGLPRLLELFDARKIPTTPSMEIYLDSEHNTKEGAEKIAAEIKATILQNVVAEDALDLLNLNIEIKLDKDKVNKINVSKEEIMSLIQKSIKAIEVKTRGEAILVEPKKAIFGVKDLQSLRIKIRNLHVKGIKGVDQLIVEKKEDEWVIRTLGSNLKRILKMPGVDGTKTTTNNIYEIAREIGIEAARNAIVKEVISTMREQGVDTDIRHVLLVADAMTRDGEVKAIGRYGVAGDRPSVLSRANFEETIKHLTIAAAGGETDPLVGIIENIIVGNIAPIGTGLVKIKVKGGKGLAKKLPEV